MIHQFVHVYLDGFHLFSCFCSRFFILFLGGFFDVFFEGLPEHLGVHNSSIYVVSLGAFHVILQLLSSLHYQLINKSDKIC